MKMSGQQRIAASRVEVWKALYDPEVLRACIPGCQSVTKESDTRMLAAAEIKIGPIGARFNGSVELSDIVPHESYTMTIDAQGGTVGFVKSIAKVRLADDGGATLLSYDVDAQVGGRLAQLGGPIMDATAKQLAARFFTQFGNAVGAPAQTAAGVAVARGAPGISVSGGRASWVTWLLALTVAGLIGYIVGTRHHTIVINMDPALLERILSEQKR